MIETSKKRVKPKTEKQEHYTEAVGRRKTAIARVRIFSGHAGSITINEKDARDYFPLPALQKTIALPFNVASVEQGTLRTTVQVKGGGVHSQAGAVRHGIARALVASNPQLRKQMRDAGLLTRDPRMKERRKFGLKKARRAPQWSKR